MNQNTDKFKIIHFWCEKDSMHEDHSKCIGIDFEFDWDCECECHIKKDK